MKTGTLLWSAAIFLALGSFLSRAETPAPAPFPSDPDQTLERTCFQTGAPWSPDQNLRSDVAIVYGIEGDLPGHIETWRKHGYRIHVMTGVSWGEYQNYLDGTFDGTRHDDEIQTQKNGEKLHHGHSTDIFYMCPGENYGKFLCVGVQRALDAGAEAIHLEEPEFWDKAGYSQGFRRAWLDYYHEGWQPPDSSVDAHWRSSKLKYFLYRRALQQVFDYIQDYNQKTGRHVRCYVATHSLLNYAQWRIVSPESSLAQLNGCDGYIAQVWTGTARQPNSYRGDTRTRTFETAFLEYGAMQNLVRATGRSVWYLNDPIEDNPDHDWTDYRTNWESTLTASLFQPEVAQFEVAPWPKRIFTGRYPESAANKKPIPPDYATELQTVFNSLNDMKQSRVEWDCGTQGVGVLIGDSLMFQPGDPSPSDEHLGNVYGLAMPLLKHGLPVTPVQLENVTVPHYLDSFRILLLSYDGQKPLSPEVDAPLAAWVKEGGVLIFCDKDADPYLKVHEWWNSNGKNYATPRESLFELLGVGRSPAGTGLVSVGKGGLIWIRERPAAIAASPTGAARIVTATRSAAEKIGLPWNETNYLLLRRGPYLLAAGLDESIEGPPRALHGRFVDLFDPALQVQSDLTLDPATRRFLLDLDTAQSGQPHLLASACKALPIAQTDSQITYAVDGVGQTQALLLLESEKPPQSVTWNGQKLTTFEYSEKEHLLWIHFTNDVVPRQVTIHY